MDKNVTEFWNTAVLCLLAAGVLATVTPAAWRKGLWGLVGSLPDRAVAALYAFYQPKVVDYGFMVLQQASVLHGSKLAIVEYEQLTGYEVFMGMGVLDVDRSRQVRMLLRSFAAEDRTRGYSPGEQAGMAASEAEAHVGDDTR